jgi:hypothetical protein
MYGGKCQYQRMVMSDQMTGIEMEASTGEIVNDSRVWNSNLIVPQNCRDIQSNCKKRPGAEY